MFADAHDEPIELRIGRVLADGPTDRSKAVMDKRLAWAIALEAERRAVPRRGFAVRHARRIRVTRSLTLAFAALVLVGTLSVAGAITYFGEWGPLDHPATVAVIDEEIASTMAAIPLPPGYTYPVEAIRRLAEPPGNLTLYVGVQTVQFHAMCAWTDFWLDGQRAGNRAQMAAALPMIEAFPKWQAVSDPRLADQSVRDQINAVVAGARAGDAAPLVMLYSGMMCEVALGR